MNAIRCSLAADSLSPPSPNCGNGLVSLNEVWVLPAMKELLHKISVATEKLERFLIMTAILAMMINSTANAIGRYAFNKKPVFFRRAQSISDCVCDLY